VNRPFSALGTLAAMLALAVFAVSSTSRSTTVGSTTSRRPATVHVRLEIPRCVPSPTLAAPPAVTVCPATDVVDDDRQEDAKCCNRWPSLEAAAVKAQELASKRIESAQAVSRALRPARVVVAKFPVSLPRVPEPMDCLSHHDLQYDLIVYGSTAEPQRTAPPLPATPIPSSDALEPADITAIFGELLASKSPRAVRITERQRSRQEPVETGTHQRPSSTSAGSGSSAAD
jgi:hypothetical protein